MEVNNIYFFDIRSKQHEKIDVKKLIDEQLKQKIEEAYDNIGLKIEIKNIKNPEVFIISYFESKGYSVIKCSPTNSYDNDFLQYTRGSNIKTMGELDADKRIILEYLEKNFEFYNREEGESLLKHLNKAGLPDLCIYKKEHKEMIIEIFFVEVKIWEDGLRGNQILWMFQNNIPVKIAYVK